MKEISTHLHSHMEQLCKRIGSRHCGSPELDRAGSYIEQCMKDCGLAISREAFPVPGWSFESFELTDITSNTTVPAVSACYYSNAVDITDVPVWLETKDLDHLEELPLQGKLCFVSIWDQKPLTRFYNQLAEKLDGLGVAAAIFLSVGQTDLSPNTKMERSPFLRQMAAVSAAQEGAVFMAGHREDTYHLAIRAKCFETTTFNVIGRLGTGPNRAVIGAHYDAAPLIEGAADNAGGVAVLLELARLIQPNPDWCIDFVAFSAEEIVPRKLPMGSENYVLNHREENLRWFLNIDGPASYFDVPLIYLSLQEKLPPIAYPHETTQSTYVGDDKSFAEIGVPSVWIFKKRAFGERHTAQDQLSCIDFPRMEQIVGEYLNIYADLIKAKEDM